MKLPYMRLTLMAALLTSAVAIACSAPEKGRTADTGATGRTVDSAGGETADSTHDMAGMDHSKMPGMAKPDSVSGSQPASGMAGMDHATMPGMSKTAPATGRATPSGSMAGMDHSNMPGMTKASGSASAATRPNPMARMDHSNMPGMTKAPSTAPRPAPATAMAGMDHSNMPGMAKSATSAGGTTPAAIMEFGASPADEKLRQIVAALVRDSVVQRRIAADSVLRRAWDNAAVRQLILTTPGGM